jgi:hypothetical protein
MTKDWHSPFRRKAFRISGMDGHALNLPRHPFGKFQEAVGAKKQDDQGGMTASAEQRQCM